MTVVEPRDFALGDRYLVERGTVLLTGIQALVRLPLDVHRADRRAGLRTATFVSGYQGSPLGTYDLTLMREAERLREHDITLTPGLNEELAATAVWGSQQDALGALAGRDGVVGIWYGKAPGVDRCGDVFRHANMMGAHPHGGVLVLAGDDPSSKSSTVPSASEGTLSDVNMPVLFPGTVQEILDLGHHAIEMSRRSGLWVAMKIVTNVADGFGTAHVDPDRIRPVEPTVLVDGQPWTYRQGGLALPPRNLDDERDVLYGRTEAARQYARVNGIDEITHPGGPAPRLGVIAAGKTALDVRQALTALGLDDDGLARAGVRLLRLGMIWPLEPTIVREFAEGLDEILVVEEKRPFVEMQVRDLLYAAPARPRIVGKRDEHGLTLVPADGELSPDRLVPILRARVPDGVTVREPATATKPSSAPAGANPARVPYFCSGCPHNRSTRVPEGSVAGGGIGCHTMAATMDRSTISMTQMGGEGAQWIGRAPFTDRPHMFQNLGDGTFFHSGSQSIRACVAAGVDITFKLLYNGAVAMTGGQDAQGQMAVPELTRLLEAEGVRRTIVCAEEPDAYPSDARWAPNVTIWPRERLDEAQTILRDTTGVTVLVYDQGCAAEKRRARKRGLMATPGRRAFINEWVCEGCGDCGEKSNCLSVQPVETELGRKTMIHQSSCNLDLTCLEGDCPSFITVHETRRSRRRAAARRTTPVERDVPVLAADEIEEPVRPEVGHGFSIVLTGVGGTGVVTMSQVLATAALLDGLDVRGLDQTGLSQKGGPVVSHVKLARDAATTSNVVAGGEADTYVGFDLLVAADPRYLRTVRPGTLAAVSTSKVPTGTMVRDTTVAFPEAEGLLQSIATATGDTPAHVDAERLAVDLFGDHMMANPLLLGVAYQMGALPVSSESIERALDLNGVAVERNQQAFRWGRRHVVDATATSDVSTSSASVPVELRPRDRTRPAPTGSRRSIRAATRLLESVPADVPREVRRLLDLRVPELVAYQSPRLASDYLDVVLRVVEREREVMGGRSELSEAVARYLFKLMAYKDEYEVARLSLRPEVDAAIADQFPDGGKIKYRLHPPVLRSLGMHRKLALGRWFRSVFRVLRAMRRVRGTPFDVFGYGKVRRTERELVSEYRSLVEQVTRDLSPATYEQAVAVAELPDLVRGYEHVKLANVERFRAEVARLLPG